jgi:hypothetical protein
MAWIAAAIVLALFIFFTKKMFVLVGVLVIVGATFGAYLYYEEHMEDLAESAVSLTVKYSVDECSEEFPLRVFIGNTSERIVHSVEWDVTAFKPGFSTNLAESSYHGYSQDKILAPTEGWSICFSTPRLKNSVEDVSKLNYAIKNKRVVFTK